MAGSAESSDDRTLWRRCQATTRPSGAAAPDPLLLAAYAEGRLSERAAEGIESWLAEHPEALDDVIAARLAESTAEEDAPQALIARAAALVSAESANVVSFPGGRRVGWRMVVAWSSMAATFLLASAAGLGLGYDTYSVYAGAGTSVQDMLDPPVGFFSLGDEDSSI